LKQRHFYGKSVYKVLFKQRNCNYLITELW